MPVLAGHHKTRVCTFWLRGRCRRSPCSFAHGELELRDPPDLTRTSMCRAFAARGQCLDAQCTFAHRYNELLTTDEFLKTKLCDFVGRGLTCRFGDQCRHAHSVEERRSAVYVPQHLALAGNQSQGSQPSGANTSSEVLSSSLGVASSTSAAAFSTSADSGAASAASAASAAATAKAAVSLPVYIAAGQTWSELQCNESDINSLSSLKSHFVGANCASVVCIELFRF